MSNKSKSGKKAASRAAAKAAAKAAKAQNAKPYFAGIDILKLLAAFFVVWIHTFLFNGFYYAEIDDKKFLLPIACRWIAYTCVPLFMIITGYLMKNKKFSGKYYLGIVKVYIIYLLVSIPCMMTDHKWFDKKFTVWSVFKGYLEYSNAGYGWYVNYYIALFCLIPFLRQHRTYSVLENGI